MPRSFQKVIEEGLKDTDALRASFIQQQEIKAPKRRPRRVGQKPKVGTLFAIRNKRLAIREAALRKVQIAFTYRKTTTSETKKYVAAPYSYRYRRLAVGRRKMLYAYDMDKRHIKSFAIREIKNVALTDRKFRPKWPIEIM